MYPEGVTESMMSPVKLGTVARPGQISARIRIFKDKAGKRQMGNGILRRTALRLKQEAVFYKLLLSHEHTPRLAKWLLWLALAYTFSPFDLIPDCIPVLGHLDDVVIVPLLLIMAVRLTPEKIRAECRAKVEAAKEPPPSQPIKL